MSHQFEALLRDPDPDIDYIVAAATNLYLECLRRRANRTIMTPTDAKQLLDIIITLAAVHTIEHEPVVESRKAPDISESKAIVQAAPMLKRRV